MVITHFRLKRAVWCLYDNTFHWCAIGFIVLIPVLFNLSYIATWMTLKLMGNKRGWLLDYYHLCKKIENEVFNTSYYLFLKCYSARWCYKMLVTCSLVLLKRIIIYTKFIISKIYSQNFDDALMTNTLIFCMFKVSTLLLY